MCQPLPVLRRLISLIFFLLCSPGFAWAQPAHSGSLFDEYDQLRTQVSEDAVNLPFVIRSQTEGKRLSAEVVGIIDQPLNDVAQTLGDVASWCDFMPLNLNVKACTYRRLASSDLLTLFLGRKFYQSPEESHPLKYRYRVKQANDDGITIVMQADQGPMGTTDYLLELDAVAIDGRTLMRVSMAYTGSWLSGLASSAYLATLGRNKQGFSVQGRDADGEPVFIRGPQAIIERNAMRYLFAMQAYLETRLIPVDERFAARAHRWFELTEVYAAQLHELEREEYLDAKMRERQNQMRLQKEAGF